MIVNAKNTGQTPAYDLTWRAKFSVQKIGEGHKAVLDSDKEGVKQTLPPGEVLSYKYSFPKWDPQLDAFWPPKPQQFLLSEKSGTKIIGASTDIRTIS